MHTIFPFAVFNEANHICYWELPYTLPQDRTSFYHSSGKNHRYLWKQKLDWIAQNGGMALLNTHPDYFDLVDTVRMKIIRKSIPFFKLCNGQILWPVLESAAQRYLVQFLNETYA